MINLTQLLLELDNSISWNRKLPHVLNGDFIGRRLYALDNKIYEKIGSDFYVKEKYLYDCLYILSTKEDNELSLRLKLRANEFENRILSKKIDSNKSRKKELYDFVNFSNFEEYYENFIDRYMSLSEEVSKKELINECWLVMSNYTTVSVIRTRITALRKVISASSVSDELDGVFTLPSRLNDCITDKAVSVNKSKMKSSNRNEIFLRDVRRIIETYADELLAINPYEKRSLVERNKIVIKSLVYLTFVNGRRPYENAVKGIFNPTPNLNMIEFSGQAKIKDGDRAANFKIDIPLLFSDNHTMMHVLTLFRENLGKRVLAGGQKSINNTLSPLADRYWLDMVERYGFKFEKKFSSIRSLYAVICERLFNQSEDAQLAQKVYMGKILGHLEYDESSWEHYFDFVVNGRGVDIKKYLKEFKENNKE